MPNSIKDQVTTDLKQAKDAGQLRAERIREIVRAAVSQVSSEFKAGSSEVRTATRDAISAVIAGLRGASSEIKDEIAASIEGAIEGVSNPRPQSVSETQAELKRLQAMLDAEEDEMEQRVESSLIGIEEAGQEAPADLKAQIQEILQTLKSSEEAGLLKRRYAQLQAQLSILKANLAARYGGRYDEVQNHLDEAQTWINKTSAEAGAVLDEAEQKRVRLEQQFGEAGTAVAKREKRIRQILSDLFHTAGDALRDRDNRTPPEITSGETPRELKAGEPVNRDLSDL